MTKGQSTIKGLLSEVGFRRLRICVPDETRDHLSVKFAVLFRVRTNGSGGCRRPGGGRKRVADLDPEPWSALLSLDEPNERGDSRSPLRWTTQPPRTLGGRGDPSGVPDRCDTVAGPLRQEGFRLQANTKRARAGSSRANIWRDAVPASTSSARHRACAEGGDILRT
ncbi:hypothetical protein SHO565_59210 [Streptomyces sp. HO565]